MIVSYFVLLFPSLYVDHIEKNNYNAVVALQEQYVVDRDYQHLEVKNPTGTITIDIPLSGNEMIVVNKFFKGTVTILDKEIITLLEDLRYYAKNPKEMPENTDNWFDFSIIEKKINEYRDSLSTLPFSVVWDNVGNEEYEWESFTKVHVVTDDFYVTEAKVTQGGSQYTTYLAITVTDQSIVVTVMSVTSPDMKDITPVVFQSLPMIVAVITLLVLLLSQVFSQWIITPIIKLSKHAQTLRRVKNMEIMPIKLQGNDEITSLGNNLNELYHQLRENYKELEINNNTLSIENERQEVFLRAFSHQLKTPISAALLLVQGMYEEVGKYKDTKVYLPKVTTQLKSMQKIVEELIYLNRFRENTRLEQIDLETILSASLGALDITITEHSLQVEIKGRTGMIETDADMFRLILDNLLANAVNHTPDNGLIQINKSEKALQIINYGVTIPNDILPHIFEPFVTSNNKQKGHGLGLYIVKYYARSLNCEVRVVNIDQGVEALICWK